MEELKCISCGGKVDINEELMIGVCEYCGTEQPLPEEIIKNIKQKKKELQTQAAAERRDKFKKKIKKVMKIIIPSLAVLIAFTIILFTLILPSIKYNNAVDLMENNNYINAAERFKDLNNFKDSASKWQECEYQQAKIYLTEENYREAVLLLEKIGSYKDSEKLIKQYKFYKLKIGELINFGVYEQDNVENGKEPITWRILAIDDSNVLLLSDYCLDNIKYSNYYSTALWEDCTLRKWLNNDFINYAFTVNEQKIIISSTLKNIEFKNNETYGGNDTVDKIFILNESEYKYFSNYFDLSSKPTTYLKSKGILINTENGNCCWWLRTKQSYSGEAWVVYPSKLTFTDKVNTEHIGVRPAVWANFETAK